MQKKKLLWLLPPALLVIAFLWWTISPLFINERVDDALPVPFTDITDGIPEGTDLWTHLQGPFPITGTPAHPANGYVLLVNAAEDQTIVRYEDYNGTNGPDLRIYLAKDLEATEFIDLGEAKGNQGNINYTVPNEIDINQYKYVLTWCRAFGVLFDYAEIN